jgi:hypothetical protein
LTAADKRHPFRLAVIIAALTRPSAVNGQGYRSRISSPDVPYAVKTVRSIAAKSMTGRQASIERQLQEEWPSG